MPPGPNPPVDVHLRRAAPADIPALGRLGALLVSLHHGFDPARFIAETPGTEHAYAAFLADQMRRPDAVLLVAHKLEAVVGYAYAVSEGSDYMALRGPAGVVHDLVVDPAHRGAGIGRALLTAAASALLDQGAPRVILTAAHRNEGAQRLFAAAGFRPTMVEMTLEADAFPSS